MKTRKVMRARVTRKGQVTIPKDIRDVLGTQEVEFVLDEDTVILRRGRSARGMLATYADSQARDAEQGAWQQAVAEAYGNG
ncbi:MAG: AbrB/MazE/SpoVT family DNA-binding domain-containing protein [Spirochaetia bacterium]